MAVNHKLKRSKNDTSNNIFFNQRRTAKLSLPSVQLALDGKPIHLLNFLATVKVSREEKDMSVAGRINQGDFTGALGAVFKGTKPDGTHEKP